MEYPYNNEKLIEIDTKLFITCRLCLEDMGVYQIVPTVQKQIKFCFDIDVDPFDGLPQLLCKKCKILLDDYSNNKKKFKEKQELLITKFKPKVVDNEVDQVEKESNLVVKELDQIENESEKEDVLIKCNISKKRRNRLISSSSSDNTLIQIKHKDHSSRPRCFKWKKKYEKDFVCNFCLKKYKRKDKLMKHLNFHSHIKSKFEDVFNKTCRIILEKSDGQPNSTGINDTVMFHNDRIFHNCYNNFFYVVYSPLCKDETVDVTNPLKRIHLDSSDEDIDSKKNNKRKIRSISGSSNETVIIDRNENLSLVASIEEGTDIAKSTNDLTAECINIDDSSDSDKEPSFNNAIISPNVECKMVDSVISVCRKNFLEKASMGEDLNSSVNSSTFESSLKHKFLSIGSKILRQNNFKCTGLLRYMEHKNLDILWLPQPESYDKRKIQICSKIKSTIFKNDVKDIWINIPIQVERPRKTINTDKAADNAPKINEYNQFVETVPGVSNSEQNEVVKKNAITLNLGAVLYYVEPDTNSGKILNQNPVANPKQLPKKLNSQVLKYSPVTKNSTENVHENQSLYAHVNYSQSTDCENYSLPIITSTTSLAESSKEITSYTKNKSTLENAGDPNKPRLKLKPVAELMKPETILNNKNNQKYVWHDNQLHNATSNVTNLYIPQVQSVSYVTNTVVAEAARPVAVNTRVNTVNNLNTGNNSVKTVYNSVNTVDNSLNTGNNSVNTVYNSVNTVYNSANTEFNSPNTVYNSLNTEYNSPNTVDNSLNTGNNSVNTLYNSVNTMYNSANTVYNSANTVYNSVNTEYSGSNTVYNSADTVYNSANTVNNSVDTVENSVNTVYNNVNTVSNSTEFVTLDTVEFPNTKTGTPFQYFRNLLLLHNLFLLEPNAPLTCDAVCFLKVKVQFKQENREKPVTLCIALYNYNSFFCITVKDTYQIDIPMDKISAKWQWEILKVFDGDVTQKILSNAERSGTDAFWKTKSFLCLLKSINSV